MLEANEELSEDTSKPAGAVRMRLPAGVALTVKDWVAEAMPLAVVKPVRLETDGVMTPETVPLRETDWVVAPVEARVIFPEEAPRGAVEARRA